MKNEIKKVPDIRFKGFIDDWEQRKFGYVFTEYSDKGHEQFPALTIIQGHGTITRDESDRNMIYDKNGLRNYKLVNKSDFIVHLRSFEGGFEIANSQGIVSPAYHVFHGEDANSRFYYPYFRSFNFINAKLKPFVYGIRDGRSIDIQGMKKALIPYPSYEEQTKIGNLLTKIDSIITLHQRKLKQLQTLKKYFLQNMFPAKEEKVPEIRFKGFTDDWEQCKLGEIVNKAVDNRGKTPPISDEGTHPLIEVACLGNGFPDYSKIKKYLDDITFKSMLREYIKKDDILFSTVDSIGLVSLMDSHENAAIAQNIVAFRAKENYDSHFLYAMFSTKGNQNKAMRIVMGAVQPSIKVSQLINVEYYITHNIKEEELLGSFFLHIDHLITLHQRKCDQLQSFKKFMLQNLFI